jgi:hypothetical protein
MNNSNNMNMSRNMSPPDLLIPEQEFIEMPFLLEDLPFLAEFSGPEVTIDEALWLLANPP